MRKDKVDQQSDKSPLIPIILGGIAGGVGSGVGYHVLWHASGHPGGFLEHFAIGLVAFTGALAGALGGSVERLHRAFWARIARSPQIWGALLLLLSHDVLALLRPSRSHELHGTCIPGVTTILILMLGSFLLGFIGKLLYYFFTLPDEQSEWQLPAASRAGRR
jgi:hypothetical protein